MNMVLGSLKYGVTTISPQIEKIFKEYLYIVKISLNSDGTLLFQKGL